MNPVLLIFVLAACKPLSGEFSPPDDAVVVAEFQDLHERVYGAYSLGLDRDALHGLLSASFGGRALTEEYVEHFVSAARMQREQTAIEVLNVDYGEVSLRRWEQTTAVLDADWSVGGVVTHRGHKHPRVNRYQAEFQVNWGDSPRIVGTKLLRLERVRSAFDEGAKWTGEAGDGQGFLDAADLLLSGVKADDAAPEWSLPPEEAALPSDDELP
jgi:hypothetical protein